MLSRTRNHTVSATQEFQKAKCRSSEFSHSNHTVSDKGIERAMGNPEISTFPSQKPLTFYDNLHDIITVL